MSTPAKLAAFAAALAVLFGGGALAGSALNSDDDEAPATRPSAAGAHGAGEEGKHGRVRDDSNSSSDAHAVSGKAPAPVRGLAVAENGLRLILEDSELRRGRTEQVRFRIVDNADNTVRDFEVEHERRMHLIVARRDLTGFQHLHPEQADDGSWTADIELDEAGSYRLFADFVRADQAYTLASDLRVDGAADLKPLPAPAATSVSDGGYDVRLDAGSARPGQEAQLRFAITKNGGTVHTEPYLGAGGHLVALRDGDLAFLHVHPTSGEHADAQRSAGHDDAIEFAATFPTEGSYRLFLQFKHEARVQTVAFTQEVK